MKLVLIMVLLTLLRNNIAIAQNHFNKVWVGNPYLAMNIYVTSALLDGNNLEAGDEIGIFDGSLCVGIGILRVPILPGDNLAIIASTNDPTTQGTDGFTAGHIITYRYWDNSRSNEITDVTPTYTLGDDTFASLGTVVADLKGSTNVVEVGIDSEHMYDFELFQNYPNPFNSSTIIKFIIKASARVSLELFSIQGELLKVLIDQNLMSGLYEYNFSSADLSSGIYLYQLSASKMVISKKFVLLK